MKYCNLFLGHEGGFAHAAAALSKPAVVIYGGWIPPEVTGYEFHENIYSKRLQFQFHTENYQAFYNNINQHLHIFSNL